jgi:hypothetical protein
MSSGMLIVGATTCVRYGCQKGWLTAPFWLVEARFGLTVGMILTVIGMVLSGVAPMPAGL